MAVDEKLRYIFEVKGSKQVESAFQGVGKSAQDAGTKTQGGIGKISSSLTGFAAKAGPLIAVGAGAALMAKRFVDAASDIEESQSKVNQIFGESGDSIIAWSKTTAEAIGQSRQEALDAASTFATFGKAAGLAGQDLVGFSTDLSKLASDLASFYNTSPTDAIDAIGAALRGESEPIRRYGVLLNEAALKQRALEMGIIKTTKNALSPQQKVLAAQAEIFAETSDAQGDFARTADGAANKQRILAAKFADLQVMLGEKLVPVMGDVVDVMIEVTDAAGPLADVLGAVASGAADAVKAVGAFGAVGKTFEAVKGAIEGVEGALADGLAIGPQLSQFGTAIAALEPPLERGNHAAEEFNATMREQARAAGRANGALSSVTEQLRLMEVGWQSLTGELDAEDAWASMTAGFAEIAEKIKRGKTEGAEFEQQTRDLKREVIDYGKEVLDLPLEHVTKLLAQIDAGAIAEVEAQLRVLTRNRTMNIDIQTRGGAGYGGRFQSFDTGGVVQGPRGSAQLVVAHAGETILPTHKTSKAGGGGVTIGEIHLHNVMNPRQVVELIRQYERMAGPGWRN